MKARCFPYLDKVFIDVVNLSRIRKDKSVGGWGELLYAMKYLYGIQCPGYARIPLSHNRIRKVLVSQKPYYESTKKWLQSSAPVYVYCPIPAHRNSRSEFSLLIFHNFQAPPPIPPTTGGSKMKSKSFSKKIVQFNE